MSQALTHPFVTVVIRSYNRLAHVKEILDVCAQQDYDRYEVVIIEQSTDEHWERHRAGLEAQGDKVRIIRSEPLGPPGARNAGVAHSQGDVVLFVDDDDLPVGADWISGHAKNYVDPDCIGISGKHIHQLGEVRRYHDMEKAYERCLTLSFMLRGRVFTGINRVKKPVEWLHGNNCSMRKAAIEKLGGWYPHVQGAGEEHSLFYRFQEQKSAPEYLMFDPQPTVLRRFDVPGGVERRSMPLRTLLIHRMQYYHWVIGAAFPLRFYGLYPLFMLYGFRLSARHLRKQSSYENEFWTRLLGRRWGRNMYFLAEFVVFPLLVFRFLFKPRPKWDGVLRQLAD